VELKNRTIDDLMMLAWTLSAQRHMPTVSDTVAIQRFVDEFGHSCRECDIEALRVRLVRMRAEHSKAKMKGNG
jgi:hypothetical protein